MTKHRFNLRGYQVECLEAIKNTYLKKNLVVLPTGAGKTLIFTRLAVDGNVLIIVNRNKLVEQTVLALTRWGVTDIGIYHASSNQKKFKKVTVASRQSLRNTRVSFDTIIIDEVHQGNMAGLSLEYRKMIGFTATPFNAKGEAIYGEEKYWKQVIYRKTLQELTDYGYLTPIVYKGSSNSFDMSGVNITSTGDYALNEISAITENVILVKKQVEDVLTKAADRKKIAFICSTINHAELVHSLLPIGEATLYHSKVSHRLDKFEGGAHRYLVTVDKVSTGYDYDRLDCVALMRPTRSKSLFVQIAGRLTRNHIDKKNGLLLDYGQVLENLGCVYSIAEGEAKPTPMKLCPMCESMTSGQVCECGFEFAKEEREVNRTNVLNLTESSAESVRAKKDVDTVRVFNYLAKSGNWCLKVCFFYGLSQVHATYVPMWKISSKHRDLDLIFEYDKKVKYDSVNDFKREATVKNIASIELIKAGKYKEIAGVEYV